MRLFLFVALASFAMASHGVYAATARLDTLTGGGSLTENDVAFSNFAFMPNVFSPFSDAFNPEADEIFVTTSAAGTTTTVTFSFDPAVGIIGVDEVNSRAKVFEFFIDFDVAVTGGSTRTLTDLTLDVLDEDDLYATGSAFAEVIFYDDPTRGPVLVEIFEDTSFGRQPKDSPDIFASRSALSLFGVIEGESRTNISTAGLSGFALTFELSGTPPVVPPTPPATPIPLPASLPLILAGLGSLAFLRRRSGV